MNPLSNSTIVIGIDPGFSNCGVVVYHVSGTVKNVNAELVASFVARVADWEDPDPFQIIDGVTRCIDHIIKQLSKDIPVVWVLERQYAQNWNPAVALKLRTVQTALLTVIRLRKVGSIELVESNTVKKFFGIATRNRAQNKVELKKVLQETYNQEIHNEHIADCVALIIFYWSTIKFS